MAQSIIDTGAAANDGTGDPLRTAFTDTNLNFTAIYAAGPVDSNVQIINNTISTINTNGNLVLSPNGTGKVVANVDIVPGTANVRNLGSSAARWSAAYTQLLDVSSNIAAGNITCTGNISGAFILGDGSQLTNLPAGSYGNANVAAYLPTFTGNIAAGNITCTGNISGAFILGDGSQLTNLPAGSYGNANVAEYLPTFTGNIAAGNITSGAQSWQFNADGSETFSSATAVTVASGKIWYNDDVGSWNLGMGGGAVTQQVGEELYRYGKASADISDSFLQLVYKTGTVGASGVITFGPTVAGITDYDQIIGCATEVIASNGFGRVTTYGVVNGTATNGTAYGESWNDNDDIWYNPVTGGLTKVQPLAPDIKLFVGTVINAGNGGSGSFNVKLGVGQSLNNLSDVQVSAPTGGQVLTYNQTGEFWDSVSITSGSGILVTAGTGGSLELAVTAAQPSITSVGTLSSLNVTGNISATLQTNASNAAGTPGQISWDADYIYVCTATDTWKRSPLTGGY